MLKANGSGFIINMSSAAGRLGYAFRTPYASAKWGVIGFTQNFSKELGPHGISVNAILPGVVSGPRMEGVIKARANQLARYALRRNGTRISPENLSAPDGNGGRCRRHGPIPRFSDGTECVGAIHRNMRQR